MRIRTGLGNDIHRLVSGRRLVLGGVEVPHPRGLLGHSDGDVVLHAVCDAMLGALGLGDIGQLFPDTDPQWQGADSRLFVREVVARMRSAGYEVGNIDVVVHAEEPRLGPHKGRIRGSLAELVGVAAECVGVKATTNEGLDAVGRGEAIACWATVLVESRAT